MSQEFHIETQSERIDLLFQRTPFMVIAQLMVVVIIHVLDRVVDSFTLHAWFATLLLCICLWVSGHVLYKGNEARFSLATKKKWKLGWLAVSSVVALTYAFGLIYLVPLDQSAAAYFIGLVTLCLVSISLIMLGFSPSAMLSFNAPLVVPVMIHLGFIGSDESMIVCAIFMIFFTAIAFITYANAKLFKNALRLKRHSDDAERMHAQAEQYQQEVSRRDGLTGLFNRRYFYEVLKQEMGRAYRNHTSLALLLIDIDHFNEYNQHYGHIEGDKRLLEIAQLLDGQLHRKGDLIARYEGGQFAYILPNIDANGAVAYAEKIQKLVQDNRIEHKASKLTTLKCITISVGVTTLPLMSRLKAKDLTQHADTALNQAKNQGRNRVKLYGDIDFDQDHV
ncbi:MAG: diguanylate cyclase [Pseudomonadota bacterium]